jgi:hypothetical protein
MPKRRLTAKVKLTVYVSHSIADRLDLACKVPGRNKSKFTEKALEHLLDPEQVLAKDGGVSRGLQQVTKAVSQIDRHQQVVIESFGLFIRYFLTVTPPLPKSEQDTARAKGHQRFDDFIAQLGRRLAGSHSLVSEVLEKVVRNDPDLLMRDLEEQVYDHHESSPGPAGPGREGEAPAPQRRSPASPPSDAAPGASSLGGVRG